MARPGKLDQRITVESYSEVADGGGGVTKTWATLATVWAHVKASTGREVFEADRVNATAVTEFVIRNRSDIDERMRIVWGGENYNIRQVLRMGQREMYLSIKAERGASN